MATSIPAALPPANMSTVIYLSARYTLNNYGGGGHDRVMFQGSWGFSYVAVLLLFFCLFVSCRSFLFCFLGFLFFFVFCSFFFLFSFFFLLLLYFTSFAFKSDCDKDVIFVIKKPPQTLPFVIALCNHFKPNRREDVTGGPNGIGHGNSWPIQLIIDQQPHGGGVPPAGSYYGTFTTPEGVCICFCFFLAVYIMIA